MRMTLPSFCGFRSRPAERIAFSIAPRSDASQGWRVMRVGSGIDMLPTWFSGVGVP